MEAEQDPSTPFSAKENGWQYRSLIHRILIVSQNLVGQI